MLAPGFPKKYLLEYKNDYVAPLDLINGIAKINFDFNTGQEIRTQINYEIEIWEKLKSCGFDPSYFNNKHILELSGGTGFLTLHLLKKIQPLSFAVNDISQFEIEMNKKLLEENNIHFPINWIIDDIHNLEFIEKFDVIIGHAFLHHLYNVPSVFDKIYKALRPGGVFIALSEPTYLSPFIEGRKFWVWPAAILFPNLFLEKIRFKKINEIPADVWVFDSYILTKVIKKTGFTKIKTIPLNLTKTIFTTVFRIKINQNKKRFTNFEQKLLYIFLKIDLFLRFILPKHAFSHIAIVCKKEKMF